MPDYSFFLCIIHTIAFVLWVSTSATEMLSLKVAYTTFLMAFFLVV
jgi:hypothetical protein